MLGIEIVFMVAPDKREEFMQATDRLCRGREEATGLTSGLYVNRAHPERLLWIERWSGEKVAEERMQSEDLRVLIGAIEVLGEMESLQVLGLELLRTRLPRPDSRKQ